MKNLVTFLVLSLPSLGFSQTEIGTVFQNNMNAIYLNVDRSPVTTGLLKDYGLMMTDVEVFDGTLQTNNYASRSVWSSLYTSVYNMRFNGNVTLPTISAVNANIDNYNASDAPIVNLMALHFNYQQFKTNAATSNLVDCNV